MSAGSRTAQPAPAGTALKDRQPRRQTALALQG